MGRSLAKTFPTFTRWAEDPRTHRAWRLARRFVGGIAKALFGTLTLAPILGALYLTGVTYLAMRGPMISDEESILGSAKGQVVELVWTRYAGDLQAVVTELIAIAAGLGALLGVVAGGVVALASRWEERTPSRAERALWTLVVAAAIHAAAFVWSMSKYPQLYERTWNGAGGARRAFQTLVSARLGPESVLWIVIAIVTTCAIVPPLVRRTFGIASRSASFDRSRETAPLALGVAALALIVAAFALLPPRAPVTAHASSDRPNVIVLGADSLRADRLDPAIMPHVSQLASRGTLFTRAYVTLARTLPSWTTMLTGEWPHHHGIRTTMPPHEERVRDRDTVVARFGKAGYATSVVTDHVGDVFVTLDYGFQDVVAPPEASFREYLRQGTLRRAKPLMPFLHSRLGRWLVPSMRDLPYCDDAGFLADEVVQSIRRHADRPFFIVGFFGAPHFPYAAPSPYFERFADPNYDGELKYDKIVWSPTWTPDEARQIRALYDGTVASFDDGVARVLAELERVHIADRTIVVILADHGESLRDANRYGHGTNLDGDEAQHIPLVVFDPRKKEGRIVTDLVRDVDLAPTLCDLAGVPCPTALDGASLAGVWEDRPLAPRLTYGETDMWIDEGIPSLRIPYPSLAEAGEIDKAHGDTFVLRAGYDELVTFAKHRSVSDGRWKLVYAPTPEAPRYLLYDAEADPLETTDVSAAHPGEVARLRARLWAWMLEDPKMENRHGWLAPRGVRIAYVDGDGLR